MTGRLVLFIFSILSIAASAQESFDSLRSIYVQEFPERFSVWPVLKQRNLYFSLRDEQRTTERIRYATNNSFTFGFGAYLFDLVLEATFAIPLSEQSKEIYGESDARDLQINMLAKKFTADVYYQKYKGFYIDDKSLEIPAGTPYPQRPDINTRNTGVGGIYVLNNRRFSLRSAFNYTDRQLRSMGSVLIGGSLNLLKVSADTAIVSTRPPGDPTGSGFVLVNNTTLALSAGYTHTVVYKDFFLNGTLAAGPGNHWIRYENPGHVQYDDMRNLITSMRLGIGYNSDRIFGGVGYSIQSRSFKFDAVRLTSTTSLFRVVVGYRFNKIGILKKRAVDFIPSGI